MFGEDLIEARAYLRARVDEILAAFAEHRPLAGVEREKVDLKEEPGRRDRSGILLPGDTQNPLAVEMLAREVPCMANSPGGGALILGIADNGRVLGTELDTEWLRHRIFERVELAPSIEERRVSEERVLVIYVAEAAEPVEDPDRKLRWRVADHCVPVDRSEWWLHRAERIGLDPMAAVSTRTIEDASPGALARAHNFLAAEGDEMVRELPDVQLLTRLGVLRPDGHLTQAGALAFCPSDVTHISVTRLDTVGGDVLNEPVDLSGLSLLEQFAEIETRLDAWNTARVVRQGFAEIPIREIPYRAIREAILNGLIHRDWMQPEPVAVTWIDLRSSLEVLSPGGFVGGVTAGNVLTHRHARYPALSDLFRALRLVEKQGLGVDRMYREMIVLGHRPPRITQIPGPRVRSKLVGGEPVVPVMRLVEAVQPPRYQRDTHIAVLIYELLHRPFLTLEQAGQVLQSDIEDARDALETAQKAQVEGEPLVWRYKDVWLLAEAALTLVENAARQEPPGVTEIVTYRRPNAAVAVDVVRAWCGVHDQITSSDYAILTGLTGTGAYKALERLVPDLLTRGGAGRNAHYRLTAG